MSMPMKSKYKKNPVLSYFIRRNFIAETFNHRGKPVLKDENFGIFGKIANLKRFLWP